MSEGVRKIPEPIEEPMAISVRSKSERERRSSGDDKEVKS